LGPVLTNEISMHVEIKSRINSGNGFLRSLLDLLSPQLLCKNINIKIIRIIILHVTLYGCETWCFTFREKHIYMVFNYEVLRSEKNELVGNLGKLCTEKTHYWYFHKTLLEVIS